MQAVIQEIPKRSVKMSELLCMYCQDWSQYIFLLSQQQKNKYEMISMHTMNVSGIINLYA